MSLVEKVRDWADAHGVEDDRWKSVLFKVCNESCGWDEYQSMESMLIETDPVSLVDIPLLWISFVALMDCRRFSPGIKKRNLRTNIVLCFGSIVSPLQ